MSEICDEPRLLVAESGRFDAAWYRRQRPGLAEDADALADYLAEGWREGLSPSARFDPAAYRAANPDVGKVDPLLHYAREGRRQGRRLKPARGDAAGRNGVALSVILPTRDRGWIVEEAIHSVLMQTHRRFELIVVDDGSRDGTAAQLRARHADALADGRMVLVELPEPRGVCRARNVGLAAARHPWIAYVDSDNLVEPHFLETFAEGILAHPQARCFHAEFFHQGSGHHLGRPFDRALLRAGNYIDLGVFVHHRDCVARHGGFDETLRRLVDWDLILTYTRDAPSAFLDEQVMLYREIGGEGRISCAESLETALTQVRAKHDIRPENDQTPAEFDAPPEAQATPASITDADVSPASSTPRTMEQNDDAAGSRTASELAG